MHESDETIESEDVILQEFPRDSSKRTASSANESSRQSDYEKRRFKALLSARRGKQSFARLVSESGAVAFWWKDDRNLRTLTRHRM